VFLFIADGCFKSHRTKERMNEYKSNRQVWDLEAYLASKPTVWLREAYNLKCTIKVLLLYETSLYKDSSEPNTRQLPVFFSANITRMLMGFSLENLVKALLLKNPQEWKQRFQKEGNLSWGKDGHNLLMLMKTAGFLINTLESRYIGLWQACATWAGRYPLPMNEHELLRQRKSAQSHELLIRAKRSIQQALRKGDPFMGVEDFDLLHSGIVTREEEVFFEIFDRCEKKLTVED
jgi:hypothetical protein